MSDEAVNSEHPKKAAFLAAYAECGVVTIACRAAGVGRTTHYEWLQNDATYKAAFGEAHESAIDLMVNEARRRAMQGVRRLKFDKHGDPLIDPETGQPYEEMQFSDTLLIFLLKGGRPEEFRERFEHTGAGGGPLEFAGQVALTGQEEFRRAMLAEPGFTDFREQQLLQSAHKSGHTTNGHANGNGHHHNGNGHG